MRKKKNKVVFIENKDLINKELLDSLEKRKDWLKDKLNVGLFLQKYFRYKIKEKESRQRGNGRKEFKADWKESFENINRLKNKHANTIYIDLFDTKLYELFYTRYKTMIENIKNSLNYDVDSIILNLSWRLLINFGIEDTHETSIFLDRNYSFPYIPSSAIKGIFSSFYNINLNQDVNTLNSIFGNENEAGKVIFFDAYPIPDSNNNNNFIVLDVMTPHYQEYYSDKNNNKEPGDWEDPNPIFFPSIQNLKFEFFIGYPNDVKNKISVSDLKTHLKEALKIHGIGAKTSVGYGYFEE